MKSQNYYKRKMRTNSRKKFLQTSTG